MLFYHFALLNQRAESSLLKEHVETQVKELSQWKQRVEELEEKERVANENVMHCQISIYYVIILVFGS